MSWFDSQHELMMQPKGLGEQQGEQASQVTKASFTEGQAQTQGYQPEQKEEPSWFDQTVGAAEYGAADTTGLLTRNIGESFHSTTFTNWADELDQFKASHPQYAPEEVSSSWDLLTNPKALVGRVSGMAPYVLFTAGTGLIPAVGPYLAGGLVYSIESERAYKSALEDGATEEEATRAGRVSGVVNGGLQLLMMKNLVSFIGSGEANLASSIVRGALGQAGALEAGTQALGFLGKQALLQATQGGVNELIPLGVYGKPIAEGFVDRRFQDAIGAVAGAEVFGPVGKLLHGQEAAVDSQGQVRDAVPSENVVKVDTTGPSQSQRVLQSQGYSEKESELLSTLYHQRAVAWAGKGGRSVEQFYAKNPISSIGEAQVGTTRQPDGNVAGDAEKASATSPLDQQTGGAPPPTSQVLREQGSEVMGAFEVGNPQGGGEQVSEGQKSPFPLPEKTNLKSVSDIYARLDNTNGQSVIGRVSDFLSEAGSVIKELTSKVGDIPVIVASMSEQFKDNQALYTSVDGRPVIVINKDIPISTSTKLAAVIAHEAIHAVKELQRVSEQSAVHTYDSANKVTQENLKPVDNITDIKSTIKGLWKVMGGDLTSEEQQNVKELFPVSKRSKLTLEDKVSDALLRYVWDGKVPDGSLIPTFDGMREWMKKQWGTLSDAGVKTKLSPGQTAFLDNLMYKDSPLVSQKRAELQAASESVLHAQKALAEGKGGAREQVSEFESQLDIARGGVKTIQGEIERLKEGQWSPRTMPEGEGQELIEYYNKGGREVPGNTKVRTGIKAGTAEFQHFLVSAKSPLMEYPSGRKTVEFLADHATATNVHKGYWESSLNEGAGDLATNAVMAKLEYPEKKWLVTVDENRESNQRKLIDSTAQGRVDENMIPSTLSKDGILTYVKAITGRNRYFGSRLEEGGFTVKRADGLYVPAEQVDGERFPRIMIPEVRQGIVSKSGPVFEAIAEHVAAHEPGVNSLGEAKALLDKDYSDDAVIRQSSSAEYRRTIRNMPDSVEVNGKEIAVFHLEPEDVMRRTVDNQASRLEWMKRFGQGTIKDITDGQIGQLGSILKIDSQLGTQALQSQLMKSGFSPEQVQAMSYKELIYNVQQMGLDLGISKQQLVDQVLQASPRAVSKSMLRELVQYAKEVGGIKPEVSNQLVTKVDTDVDGTTTSKSIWNPQYDATDLLNKIKERLTTKVNDNLTVLTDNFVKEGGDLKAMQNVLRVSQGLPYRPLADNMFTRSVKLGSDIIGAMQTTFAVIPHLFSNLTQLPQIGGKGNFIEALGNMFSNYKEVKAASVLATGIVRSELARRAEPSYSMTRVGEVIRKGMATITGLDRVNEFQVALAYETMRGQAQSWMEHGIDRWDTQVAKRLGLTQAEIDQTNAGKMSDLTFSKVIQQGVGIAQPAYERPYNKALVESWPLLKGLFAYNTYVFGNTRQNFGIINDLKEGMLSGDVVKIGASTSRFMTALAGSVGAGVAISMLRESIKGTTPQHLDESYWDTALGALNETAGLGMVHRFSDAFKYNGGVLEKTAFGLMPQVSALTNVLGAALGYGRFGELSLTERVGEALKQQTTAVRAFNQWADNVAHPELVGYQEARASMTKWTRENETRNSAGNSDTPVNPDYYHVFQAVERGDMEGARDEAIGLIQRKLGEGVDPQTTVDGLRTSLINRAPVDVSVKNLGRYLGSLSSEQRSKYLQSHVQYMRVVNVVAPHLGT